MARPASAEQAAHGFERFDVLYGDEADCPQRSPDPMAPAGIVFTSGTTSRPKAVVHTHANALWAARVGPTNISMHPGGVYLVFLPFFHVNAQSWSMWTTVLGAGGTIVLQPKFSASRFWAVIAKHDVTHISLLPIVYTTIARPDDPAEQTRGRGIRSHCPADRAAAGRCQGGAGIRYDRDRHPRDNGRALPAHSTGFHGNPNPRL